MLKKIQRLIKLLTKLRNTSKRTPIITPHEIAPKRRLSLASEKLYLSDANNSLPEKKALFCDKFNNFNVQILAFAFNISLLESIIKLHPEIASAYNPNTHSKRTLLECIDALKYIHYNFNKSEKNATSSVYYDHILNDDSPIPQLDGEIIRDFWNDFELIGLDSFNLSNWIRTIKNIIKTNPDLCEITDVNTNQSLNQIIRTIDTIKNLMSTTYNETINSPFWKDTQEYFNNLPPTQQ